MKYTRFEELPVWQASIGLAVEVYRLTSDAAFTGQGSLRDQFERAAVSVPNNIAEGFERGTNNELLHFLYIARGSAGEVRSMLCLIERLPAFINLKFEISTFEIGLRKRVAPTARVGRFVAELGNQRAALPN